MPSIAFWGAFGDDVAIDEARVGGGDIATALMFAG